MILFLVFNDTPMEPLQDSIFCLEQIFQGVFTWSAVLSILLDRVNDARQVIRSNTETLHALHVYPEAYSRNDHRNLV
jgi:hypothetical protein